MPENDLLASADKQTLSGAFGINPSITTDGVPAIGWYIGKLDVNAGAKKITLTESNGAHRTWTNTTDAGEWTEWVPQANATPPQKFTAPLSDGYSGTLSYLKTQESIVIVSFDVYKTDNSTINGTNLISTLPEGFRGVSGYCAALAMGVGGGNIVGAAQAWCDTEGIIRTLCPSGTYRIRGEIVFCAN